MTDRLSSDPLLEAVQMLSFARDGAAIILREDDHVYYADENAIGLAELAGARFHIH